MYQVLLIGLIKYIKDCKYRGRASNKFLNRDKFFYKFKSLIQNPLVLDSTMNIKHTPVR